MKFDRPTATPIGKTVFVPPVKPLSN